MATFKYKVIDLEVWGNETDGYCINNFFSAGTLEFEAERATDELILTALKDQCYVREHVTMEQVEFVDIGERMCELAEAKTGKPVFHLESLD